MCRAMLKSVSLCVCALFLASSFLGPSTTSLMAGKVTDLVEAESHIRSELVTHAPITISSDSDFIDQGWPGSGTDLNPYIISELAISSDDACIAIADTTVFFFTEKSNN